MLVPLREVPEGSWFKLSPEMKEDVERKLHTNPGAGLERRVVPDYGKVTDSNNDGWTWFKFATHVLPSVTFPPYHKVEVLDRLPEGYALHERMGKWATEALGWDPEIFVTTGAGELMPAFNFLKDKRTALETRSQRSKAYAYWDGFQAEFNVDVTSCNGYGIDRLREGLLAVLYAAREKDKTAKLALKNVFRIPQYTLFTAAEEFVTFGCNGSESAYGREPVFFEDARAVPYRCAGGHIHFGGKEVIDLTRQRTGLDVVKVLDRFLGVPCVALFDGIDDPRRREMYGKAGEFRLPQHGLEYRTLSNAWLCHPAITHLVMNQARAVLALRGWDPGSDLSDEETQEIINNCDATKARRWLEGHWPLFSAILDHDMGHTDAVERSKNVWIGGVANEIRGFDAIEVNWKLDGEWSVHSDFGRAMWGSYAYTR